MFFPQRFRIPLAITFAFVATHNHFVLDRGGKVFKQSAPVIKLPAGASEADHLALLGLLNSSTACFWMKQVFHNKGGGGIGGGLATEEWEQFYEHTGTGLKGFPVAADPEHTAGTLAEKLDQLAQQLTDCEPSAVLARTSGNLVTDHLTNPSSVVDEEGFSRRHGAHGEEEKNSPCLRVSVRDSVDPIAQPGDYKAALSVAKAHAKSLFRQMIALQEELDWRNYQLYGLTDEDLCYGKTPPEIQLGERPFEILLARRMTAGETETTWFQRHGSTPITEIPAHWPADYRALTERHLQAIQDNRWIRLIEQPEYKRRWNREPWEKRQQRALREWLLDHLEQLCQSAEFQTCAQLADRTRHDDAFQRVAAIYTGTDIFDSQALVSDLVAADNVPQMAAARYKPRARPKFRAWQETWDKQRAEDAIDARTELDPSDPDNLTTEQATALKAKQIGDIPLPPKYAATDFRRPSYWPLRGKLDVPKERFFSLPYCEKEGDSTLVIGWAGLNHLQRAQAIAGWYLERKEQEGWGAERLKPMLVALDELIPWLKQWYNEIDPEYGERLGDYYEGFLLEELRQLELSRDELGTWEPPVAKRSRRRRSG